MKTVKKAKIAHESQGNPPKAKRGPDYETTRIWKKTLAKLRLLRAMTGRAAIHILDSLVTEELARLKPSSVASALNAAELAQYNSLVTEELARLRSYSTSSAPTKPTQLEKGRQAKAR
jgi:hypothetical protein